MPGQPLWVAAILPILVHIGLLFIFDLAACLAPTLILMGVGYLGLVLAGRRLAEGPAGKGAALVLGVALLLRLLLIPVPPSLSDDIYRYVWDGRVLTAGYNPYLVPPEAPELVPLHGELWSEVSHRDVPTVYPPLAQALFALSTRLPGSIYGLKATLALMDLGTCALLLLLARLWKLPPGRTIWYAWNPLVVVEIAGMGHIDALAVVLMVLTTALLALPTQRVVPGALAAAGAVLSKLVPVVAFPVWARQSQRAVVFALVALSVAVLGLLPVFWSTGGVPAGLVRYGVSWEFNGPLFEPLWRILDRIELPGLVEEGLNRLRAWTGSSEPWNSLYHYNYPQLWAKAMLSLGLLVALVWSWRTDETLVSLRRVFGSVVVFSATVYPWYALWVLPWAALSGHRAWLCLSGLLTLSYLPQFFDVPLFPWVYASIWIPFAILLLWKRS